MASPDQSALDFIADKWITLCRSMRFTDADTKESCGELRQLLQPLAALSMHDRQEYNSYIADDGFPVECSISWTQLAPEVRLMFESAGSGSDPRKAQDAGRFLTRGLAARPGVSIDRYLAIEELFLSALPARGQATIWHAIARRKGSRTRYKIYLNPRVYGLDRAAEVVGEAMARMGLAECWQTVATRQSELFDRGHRIEFLALDLEPSARVKVYYRHETIPFEELDTVASLAARHDSSRAVKVYRLCYGNRRTIDNAPLTCLAFSGTGRPEHANVYLRLDKSRGDAPIRAVMRHEGIGEPPVVPGAGNEFLSYRTRSPHKPADIGLYMRFALRQAAPERELARGEQQGRGEGGIAPLR